jgi:hypothetical protein
MDIETLISQRKDQGDHYVNADEWRDIWEEKWIIFADLIAFAERCLDSETVTLNNIVQFHRAVSNSVENFPKCTKYQFTDASFILTDNVNNALKIATNLHHECLAQNAIELRNDRHTVFKHFIIPSITISKGNILNLTEDVSIDEAQVEGIAPGDFLAGEGIVKAYKLEKSSSGGITSLSIEDSHIAKNPHSSQERTVPRRVYKHWRNEDREKYLHHDGVVDHPWIVLEASQSDGGQLALDSQISVFEKIKLWLSIWDLSFREFTIESLPTSTAKHRAHFLRHLSEIVRGLTDSRLGDMTTQELRTIVNKKLNQN